MDEARLDGLEPGSPATSGNASITIPRSVSVSPGPQRCRVHARGLVDDEHGGVLVSRSACAVIPPLLELREGMLQVLYFLGDGLVELLDRGRRAASRRGSPSPHSPVRGPHEVLDGRHHRVLLDGTLHDVAVEKVGERARRGAFGIRAAFEGRRPAVCPPGPIPRFFSPGGACRSGRRWPAGGKAETRLLRCVGPGRVKGDGEGARSDPGVNDVPGPAGLRELHRRGVFFVCLLWYG